MKEFIKFMFFYYWNDFDDNIVGGRGTLIFCWLMMIIVIYCGYCFFEYPIAY